MAKKGENFNKIMSKEIFYDHVILEKGESKWKQHKNICYEITKELKDYPCSYLYEETLECKLPDNNVKHLSFPIILNNIENDTYKELQEWLFDMKLLLISPYKVHKRDDEFAICFDFVQRLLKKSKRFNLTTFKGWEKTIKAYKLKIDSLLQTAPPVVRTHFPLTIPPIEYTTKKIGPAQIEFIMKNYHKIQNPNDIHAILNIIRLDVNGNEPKEGLLEIDLSNLSMPTKCKIFDFMRYRMKIDEAHSPRL